MIIVCPRCGILYSVDQSSLGDESRTVRCSNCAWEWMYRREDALPDSDETLRLLAMSVGRGLGAKRDSGSASQPAAPHTVESASKPAPQPTDGPPARPLRPVAEDIEPETDTAPATIGQVDPAEDDGEPERASAAVDAEAIGDVGRGAEEDSSSNGATADAGGTAVAAGEPVTPFALRPDPKSEAVDQEPSAQPADTIGDASIPPAPFGDGDTGPARPGPRRTRVRLQRPAAIVSAAIAATLLVSVGLLAATRGTVTAAFPGAAGFYSAIGLSTEEGFAEGLEIRDVSSTRSWTDGAQVLTVAGDLANTAKKPRVLPMVRVVLVDGSDTEVQEVVVVPPGETLPVGESVRFEAQISNPAETAERIKVSLTPRPKSS